MQECCQLAVENQEHPAASTLCPAAPSRQRSVLCTLRCPGAWAFTGSSLLGQEEATREVEKSEAHQTAKNVIYWLNSQPELIRNDTKG